MSPFILPPFCATYLTLSLRDNGIATPQDMAAFQNRTEETLASLTKQRTILNVRKKKREPLYASDRKSVV